MIKYIVLFYFVIFSVWAENNYFESNFKKNDLNFLKKKWVYKSNIFKDTQTKPSIINDKIVYLDGYKNLRVISLFDGEFICMNQGKKDRGFHRGIGIYKKNEKENYAVFVRHGSIKLVNISTCKEKKHKIPKVTDAPISAPIYINNNVAFVLPNGGRPFAIDLDKEEILWKASFAKKDFGKIKKQNLMKDIRWDVWGGGVIDLKYNQLIFSTANAKPSWHSKGRLGPNLLFNSVVSIDLKTGIYKWHFQEIEHDLWNLDLAAPPILLDFENTELVAQATKTGQLILLNRKDGNPTEKIIEKKFDFESDNKKTYSIFRYFPDWLQYSRGFFLQNDINSLNSEYSTEARRKINSSKFGDYIPLGKNKKFIYYGIHGGTQWPGIASTPNGIVIIPSNNIAYRVKLKDPAEFNFRKEFIELFTRILNIKLFNFLEFKQSVKQILKQSKKIINFNSVDIEKWEKFTNKDGIPLNNHPWGVLVAIDVKNKIKKWEVPHGSYPQLKNSNIETGSEIFGSPIILSTGIVFIAGTDDKKIRAYSIDNGEKLWEDKLPFSSYGSLVVAEFEDRQFLIVNSSSGANFDSSSGDAIVAYELSK